MCRKFGVDRKRLRRNADRRMLELQPFNVARMATAEEIHDLQQVYKSAKWRCGSIQPTNLPAERLKIVKTVSSKKSSWLAFLQPRVLLWFPTFGRNGF
jgi:hypothetical protein